jgi:hypothetical protein
VDDTSFHAAKALIKLGADPRKALTGKFCGWILALARSREARDAQGPPVMKDVRDLTRYFEFSPDPEPDAEALFGILNKKRN